MADSEKVVQALRLSLDAMEEIIFNMRILAGATETRLKSLDQALDDLYQARRLTQPI